ncbi:HET-domain-containing protein [Coniochaeta ligniaria NRRL 30616]|uniref:HET-domain-containing protein n=1 Tax=Coniochaeta ligniaria NRRL 30616 TaxID=1408157 RepID=A0A1J7J106_9PEZI|nr:HET-domain-containing protein [Coniochaeta ligniaria NRRL 30616]
MNYQYAPLSSPRCTRLIKLQGSSDTTGQIAFKLDETSLDRPKSYEALSYTWGGQPLDRPVSCDGRTLLVTANAEAALHRLRNRVKTRSLWVDAICINQTSTAERNVQVANMGDIYRCAKQVLVWVGDGTAETDAAFAAMADWWHFKHKLHMQFRRTWASLEDVTLGKTISREMNAKMSSDERLQLLHGLDDVVGRPYWTRVWTLQEVGLCRGLKECLVHCGAAEPVNLQMLKDTVQTIGGQVLEDALAMHFRLSERGSAINDKRSKIYYKEFRQRGSRAGGRATEPRDFVFGLRELFPDELGRIPVSYERPTADLYLEVAQRIIEKGASLDILAVAAQEAKAVAGCASWVPDWSSLSVSEAARQLFAAQNAQFSACRGMPALFAFRSPSTLVLTGREIVTVGSEVSARFPHGFDPDLVWRHTETPEGYDGEPGPEPPQDYVETWRPLKLAPRDVAERNGREMLAILQQWLIRAEEDDGPVQSLAEQPPREQMAQLLWWLLIRDDVGRTRRDGEPELVHWLGELKQRGPDLYPQFVGLKGNHLWKDGSHISTSHHDFAYWLDGQQLFWTADGRLGLGTHVRPGDTIAVVAGCCSAVALRKVEGEKYRFVGHCVVLGTLMGEGWPEDDSLLREFELC